MPSRSKCLPQGLVWRRFPTGTGHRAPTWATRRKTGAELSRLRRRAVVVYVTVLLIAMLLTGAGITLIATQMADRRMQRNLGRSEQAALLAQTGIEWALWSLNKDAEWRDKLVNGDVLSLDLAGLGSFTVTITDDDEDLADWPRDSLNLSAEGLGEGTFQYLQVIAQPEVLPLEALNTCLHAETEVHVHGGNQVTAIGAPVSCNGNIRNDEIIDGDVEAASLSGGGVITGSVTVPAPAKDMPGSGVFDYYVSIATEIPYFGHLTNQALAPGYNPWGATNPDGVYYIDTLGQDIDIQITRIHGTLVVDCPGKRVCLKQAVLLHNYRADYPVLVVNGRAELDYDSGAGGLSEVGSGVNFNPLGAPYEGDWDADLVDVYPSEVRGLVHATDEVRLKRTARIHGTLICQANVHVEGDNEIEHDPGLVENPPIGYEEVGNLKVVTGSWK